MTPLAEVIHVGGGIVGVEPDFIIPARQQQQQQQQQQQYHQEQHQHHKQLKPAQTGIVGQALDHLSLITYNCVYYTTMS
jgi:hypothetical protein